MSYMPFVIEKTKDGERHYDVYSRLLQDRILFITGVIDEDISNLIVAELLYLDAIDNKKDIHIYINSPGGLITQGLAILDVMKYCKSDIRTYCVGLAASMGSILLAGGTKGKRYAMPNSKIMIHQPSSGFEGRATDIEIHTKELMKTKAKLITIFANDTGKPEETVKNDMERDYYLTANEAKEYGIIDHVITKKGANL